MSDRSFSLADLFELVADAVPEREAMVCGDRRLTFAQLDERATRLAHHLAANGVGAGDHVGLYLYNGTEYIEGMIAVFKIRAVPINVNFRYVEEELRYLFADADVVAVVHHREFADRLAAIKPDLPKLRHFVAVEDGSGADLSPLGDAVADYDEALAAASPERDFAPRSSDDHYILYTGGTTGMPKGVVWRQEDIFFAAMRGGNLSGPPITRPEEIADNARNGFPASSLPASPFMHGTAHWAAFIFLFAGGRVVVPKTKRFDPDEMWRLVDTEKVNNIVMVGDAQARPLLDALEAAGGAYDVSSLLVLTSGGAILSPAVKEQFLRLLPHAVVYDGMGSSETGQTGEMTLGAGSDPAAGPRFMVNEWTTVLGEDYQPVERGSGQVGQVARRGRIPVGYYNDPEKTGRTFVEAGGHRWVLSGDMATVDADGVINLLGRGSVSINSGGEKVFPEEVEAALKSHPDVFDAVVVGVPDERWGERVTAVVQPRPGAAPTRADLDAHCRTRIAGYKVPRELHLVDEIVRSPSGKPDYRWAKSAAMGTPASA